MRPNGSAIREIREAKRIGIRELAARTGRSRPFLSRIERGQRGASPDTVQKIADAIGAPITAITCDPMEGR